MNRRTFLTATGGLSLAAVAGGWAAYPGLAQDSSPTAEGSGTIPPIRWDLVSIDADDDALIPEDPTRYTIQFLEGGDVFITADCNGAGGRYEIDGESIAISDVVSTLMFCGDESIDQQFLEAITSATSWDISQDGSDQLALIFGDDRQALFSASLAGVTWKWQSFAEGNDDLTEPDDPSRYALTFFDDGTVNAVMDCNTGKGDYTTGGSDIELTIAATKKACGDDSLFDTFASLLDQAVSYVIRDGQLHLALPMDAGIATFAAVPPDAPELATPEADA